MKVADHERFRIRRLDQLRGKLDELGLSLPISENFLPLAQPIGIGPVRLPNRFAVHPMEGFDSDPDGAPGPLSFRRYLRYARGGFGLIWMEATAVLHEARSNPSQLWISEANVGAYARLVKEVRQAAREAVGRDIGLIIQLTHSGRYSRPTGIPEPIIAHHSPMLDPKHGLPPDYPLVTDEYLDRLQDVYVNAARLAAKAGFDGVDIKSCHRYLVAELHASFTRQGRYGGSFENRTRLLRETLARIQSEVPGVFITTRLNAYDAMAHPYGFGVSQKDHLTPDLGEPLRLVSLLKEIGIPILNVSIGNPYFKPHFGRPYDFPIKGMGVPEEHPLAGIVRFIGITRAIQEKNPDLPVIGSGYSWLRQFIPHVAAGVLGSGGATLLGLGRGAFAYPDTPRDVLEKGAMDPSRCCVACSGCTQIMRDGGHTGCVVRDSQIYGPEYRLARRFALDHLVEEAQRCRECESPTCATSCPAHVHVPAFLKAFAAGDIARAYDVLREANVLPEMCAYVCPSEVQCEGGCLEKIFCDRPVPIRDIQLVTCQIARRKGLTGLRLPAASTGRRVAVVGGGPAGLAAAVRLLEAGHIVTVFERGDHLGGTPDTLIPADRYGNALNEIEAILAPAVKAGRVHIMTGHELGRNLDLTAIRASFDAVLLAMGLSGSHSLGQCNGVVDALAFLRQVKAGAIRAAPDRVAVLGGGNTAMDAALAARQLGARDVYLIYRRSFSEMPAWPEARERFMTSGGHCLVLTQPVAYLTGHGAGIGAKLDGLRIARTELGDPDASGRRRPSVVPQSESVLKVDLVIEALGQTISDEVRHALADLTFTREGFIQVEPGSFRTSREHVYAAGDMVNGGTTAVQCISEGMRAAAEISVNLKASATET